MHIRRITRIYACSLALFFLGFGQAFLGAPRSRPSDFQKPDVEVISNPKTPVPPVGKRKRLVFKEELGIGQKEGDENYMFGSAVFFNTDEEGNFYVSDWDKKRILKYDPAGKYVLTIGRKGQGPGEFQNLSIARFDKEGSIYVTDIAGRRISFFNQGGIYLRQVLIPDVYEDLSINSKGNYISSRSVRLEGGTGMAWNLSYGIFNDKFELVTEFYSQVHDTKPPAGRDAAAMAKFTAGILSGIAFHPNPRYVLAANDSIYFGNPSDYSIDVYSPEGLKFRTVRRDYDPLPVTDRDKEYFVDEIARPFLSRGGIPRTEEEIRDILKFIEYPKFKPAYNDFALMENGWLVVLAEFSAGDYSLFDIFDENGRYIGQFKADLPAEYGLFFFKKGKAYTVETDEEGFKFVKRYGVKVEDY